MADPGKRQHQSCSAWSRGSSVLCRCLQWGTKLDEATGETGGLPEDT